MSEAVQRFLQSLHRFDLAMLLSVCEASVVEAESSGSWSRGSSPEAVVVHAPAPVDAALRSLPPQDRIRIAEAVCSAFPTARAHDEIRVEARAGSAEGAIALLSELLIHREMMISVATHRDRIQNVNDYYIAREARIRGTLPAEVPYENPHPDLWSWYHHWQGGFGSYSDRRQYVRQLFAPTIEALAKRSSLPLPQREPTGWERVDRAMSKARAQLELASAEEDFQAIGLLCREVIISLAQAVYDPEIHQSVDGVKPSLTDANRMLEAYVAHVFPGESYKEVRAHARASLALALSLQHRRTATRQLAALCVEGTASTAAVVSIIARSSPG